MAAMLMSGMSCGDDCSRFKKLYSPIRQFQDNETQIAELIEKIRLTESKKPGKRDLRSGSDLAGLHEQLGGKYLNVKNWNKSIIHLKKSVEMGINTPAVFYLLGLAYANRHGETGFTDDLDEAENSFKRSLELRSEDNMAAYELSMLLFNQRNQKKNGLLLMESFVANNKKYYRGRLALGRMYYDVGEHEKALAIYKNIELEMHRLPDSEMVREYKKMSRGNIEKIMMEISNKK